MATAPYMRLLPSTTPPRGSRVLPIRGAVSCLTAEATQADHEGATVGGLTMEWRDYITVDPNVSHGQACIAGTRGQRPRCP